MSDKDKTHLSIAALVIAVIIIVWLLLRNNVAAQSIIRQNVPWAVPLFGGNTTPTTYDVSMPGYVPATVGPVSAGKCDSNSPCIFCTIPNATFPTPPVKVTQNAAYVTANYNVPKTFGLAGGSYDWTSIAGTG